MTQSNIGFSHDLYILPFDHRGSFQEKLFGIKGRQPNAEETVEISSYKRIVYDGFIRAIEGGILKSRAGILVDEQFGADILKDARARGLIIACPAEKSGQDEFDFEYGADFGAHIEKISPTFVKVLVRYNPEGDSEMNLRQSERLKRLSDYCHAHGHKFMFELLVPATEAQLAKAGGNTSRYDREFRPALMTRAMAELQVAGIEPDVWKLEGIETESDCRKVARQARAGFRQNVGVIVLGRGENAEKVRHWLATAAQVPGLIGFAVGRTVFWEPLKGVQEGRISREQAVEQIAQNYKMFCELWDRARMAEVTGSASELAA